MTVRRVPVSEKRQAFYTRVYRQCFSPDGEWLVAADSRSRLCIFSLSSALSQRAFSSPLRPLSAHVALKHNVFALHSLGSIIVCGDSQGRLFGYQWPSLKRTLSSSINPKKLFEVDASAFAGVGSAVSSEINAISSIDNKIIYGGAGRNTIQLIDPERPDKVVSSFNGHEDYVNELKARSSNEFLSASEDGTVRLWDLRMSNVVHTLRVFDEPQLKRPECGKGVCALDVQGSFFVCGGDVHASIWHIESRSLASPLLCEDFCNMRYTVAKMTDDKILVGGTCPLLAEFNHAGKKLTSVKTSPNCIYSIESNTMPGRAMTTVAGDSQFIDSFLNLGYVSFSFDTSFSNTRK